MTDEQVRHAPDLLTRPANTVTSIAKLLGVSRNTIYNWSPCPMGHATLRLETRSVGHGAGGSLG